MISPTAVRVAKTVSVATMIGAMTSCATTTSPLTTNTVGLPICDAHDTPITRFWVTIRLRQHVDDVFDPGVRSGPNVTYSVLSTPASRPSSKEIDAKGQHLASPFLDVNKNPYDSDLHLLTGIQANDVVGYRVILDNSATNYAYYQESNARGNGDDLRGMAVIPRSRSKFVCSRLSFGETDTLDGKTKDFVYFYIAYRQAVQLPPYDSFSVFLVPKAGATTTVVIIDPKIMNSG